MTLALLPAIPGPAAAETAASLALDTTWRGGPLRGGADLFRLDVPEPGILTLDVSAPADAETPPTIEVLGDFELLYQSPAGLAVELEAAGAVLLAVAPEDPEHPLERYKLRNAFTPLPGTLPGLDKEVAERREDDDLRHESPSLPLRETLPGGLDKEVAERREDDDLRHEPPSLPLHETLPGGLDKEVAERREDDDLRHDSPPFIACAPGGDDDHADTPWCATPLDPGHVAGGELDNAFGDDEDYFTFVLSGQQTVAIAAAGEDDGVLGVLYDHRGQRLAAGDRCQLGDEPRLVRSLSPGRYFVRVENPYLRAGSYTLSVTPLKSF